MKPFGGVSEQARAAVHRRADAQALLEKERWRGAMYLAGYALECTIKSRLMRKFACRNLDELDEALKQKGLIPADATVYDHRIELYVRAGGGLERLRDNQATWSRYIVANRWHPSRRYNPDLSARDDALDFLSAVDAVLAWLDANI